MSHWRAPSFHSWNKPKIKIKIKYVAVIEIIKKFADCVLINGMGKISVISTSKIKKIKAIK